MTDGNFAETMLRVRCILRHCDHTERDGAANSLGHVRQIYEDARALEDLLHDDTSTLPVHL